ERPRRPVADAIERARTGDGAQVALRIDGNLRVGDERRLARMRVIARSHRRAASRDTAPAPDAGIADDGAARVAVADGAADARERRIHVRGDARPDDAAIDALAANTGVSRDGAESECGRSGVEIGDIRESRDWCLRCPGIPVAPAAHCTV